MSGSTSNNNIIGSGSDTIVLNLSEDQAEGQDAQFTVNVDGQQIGGPQSVSASHSAGQDETFTFQGNYGPGSHNVVVTFNNNLIFPGDQGDRNLYVDGVTYDGQTVSSSTTPVYGAPFVPPNSTDGAHYGNAVYTVNDTTPVPDGTAPNPTDTPGAVSVGSGADTLVLNMAEDPYQGDAQFTVSVDGQQIGGTQTTTAIFDQGQSQEFDVHGNFGSGTHTVAVDFLNDKIGDFYPGTTWAIDTTDRNLYVMGGSLDGGPAMTGTPWELSNSGTENFSVTAGSNPSATASDSRLFAGDGAAGTPDNAAITSASLAAGTPTSGSSTGMTLLAPSTTSGTTATSATGTDPTGTSSAGVNSTDASSNGANSSGAGTTIDTTPSITAAAGQTTQDFSIPSTPGSSGIATSDNTSASGGSWLAHQPTHGAGSAFPHHG